MRIIYRDKSSSPSSSPPAAAETVKAAAAATKKHRIKRSKSKITTITNYHYGQQYTLISWMRGEQSKLFPKVSGITLVLLPEADKPRATVPYISPDTEGQHF
ncbi:hypothetical protein DPMN_101149 [Dreissena polymorpha]|uniref:Uncharacterized protein n=1 Tax=Dreissena polymorpha TaxID=45954 RepID=A0A9D4R8U9_DREPO|nr:hypothetical protein DPMN_101149 [Dreissena polymorpha]